MEHRSVLIKEAAGARAQARICPCLQTEQQDKEKKVKVKLLNCDWSTLSKDVMLLGRVRLKFARLRVKVTGYSCQKC